MLAHLLSSLVIIYPKPRTRKITTNSGCYMVPFLDLPTDESRQAKLWIRTTKPTDITHNMSVAVKPHPAPLATTQNSPTVSICEIDGTQSLQKSLIKVATLIKWSGGLPKILVLQTLIKWSGILARSLNLRSLDLLLFHWYFLMRHWSNHVCCILISFEEIIGSNQVFCAMQHRCFWLVLFCSSAGLLN